MPSFSPKKNILLVNPWVHDFSAYDFWMKPLGLLYVGSILRSKGARVFILDFLNGEALPEKYLEGLKPPKRRDFGRGHFYKEVITKPSALQAIPRLYRRYGIPPAVMKKAIADLPRPNLILITSLMTYWYPGLFATIIFLKENFPGVPVLLGGTYATLCPAHARKYSGADRVLTGPWNGEKMRIVSDYLNGALEPFEEKFPSWPFPAFDLYPRLEYVCLLTRCGCPFTCTYCASSKLAPRIESRTPESIVKEIIYWRGQWGIQDFAFYDDALLLDSTVHILPILQEVNQRNLQVHFHAPNALHAGMIDKEVATILFRGGFKTIRVGLETASETRQRETGGKVNNAEFKEAVRNLKLAGYAGEEIGVYLMAGLPGQRVEEVEESIAFVKEAGAKSILVEYSPIPGTPLFEQAKKFSTFDLEEPLWQNNSILPCRWEGFTWEDFRRLKKNCGNRFFPCTRIHENLGEQR